MFAVAIDPVRGGFAASLARPGGNITGLSVIDVDPNPKRLELLQAMVPALSQVAVLVNPATSAHAAVVKSVQAAASQAGLKVLTLDARTPGDIERALAAIAPWREYVAAGGLMSYGHNIADSFRRAATYVDRILKGARPGELPIEQPTTIHLAINRKTAAALGLTISRELLLRADSVVE